MILIVNRLHKVIVGNYYGNGKHIMPYDEFGQHRVRFINIKIY